MQPFGLRINRSRAHAARDKYNMELFQLFHRHFAQIGRSSQRSDKIFERISRFAVEILRCTDTDRLEDNLDRPFLTVIICDCERNSLSCLIQLGDNKLAGHAARRDTGRLHDHLVDVAGEVFRFQNLIHGVSTSINCDKLYIFLQEKPSRPLYDRHSRISRIL